MSLRAELEASLAKADADWRRAKDDLDKAQAEEARANAYWEKLVADGRKADAERRDARDDLSSRAKAIVDRHRAYAELGDAEARCAQAEARLKHAITERNKASAALAELDAADGKQ